MSSGMRKGWCPSVLRPMPTGDGLLVRLRPLAGVLSLVQAAEVAACAAAFGNRHVDLTSRGSLQIRGVREATLPDLVERLHEAGLVGDAEAGLDIVASPLAGVDPGEWLDVRPVVAALAERTTADEALRRLPAKFGFVVDGGGEPTLRDVAADVRFTAIATDTFGVEIADRFVGTCAADAVPDVAGTLAARFLEVCGDDSRMRRVIERTGLEPFKASADEVGSDEGGATARIPSVPTAAGRGCRDRPHPTLADARAPFSRVAGEGARVLGDCKAHLGIAAPFGRLEASDLADLALLASANGAADIRLTPWRALFVTGLSQSAAKSLAARLDPSRFILDPNDSRRAVAACPGAPACASGTTSTRADAALLAPFVARPKNPGAIALHVSGCAKGCAHAGTAPVTLVGNAGRYDLVRDGTAQSAPCARGLTAFAAAAMLARIATEGGAAA